MSELRRAGTNQTHSSFGGITMVAVGIDVSKAQSTVAMLNDDGSIREKPFTMHHTLSDMSALVNYLKDLDDPPIILIPFVAAQVPVTSDKGYLPCDSETLIHLYFLCILLKTCYIL